MFGKNLKYYRLKNDLSMKELADLVQISPMAISYYEREERRPDMETIKVLAKALGVRVTDFLASRDETLVFCHQEFRKNNKLSAKQQEYIKEEVEEYFSRFFEAVNVLGGEVLSNPPKTHILELSNDEDKNAMKMREHLNISTEGPIKNLTESLENKGVLIHFCDIENDDFSGMNGKVNDRPYIVVNKNMTAERVRSTIAHEMVHALFSWPENIDQKSMEKTASATAAAFLFPASDVKRELGIRRTAVTNDMLSVSIEYGISMFLLTMRANKVGVLNDNITTTFHTTATKAGWKRCEPSRIPPESPKLFEQLVYRAVSENEITAQKGAELLKLPYEIVAQNSATVEV